MTKNASVLVDTNLWIEFFSHSNNRHRKEVQRLLNEDHVRTCGPILYEVLVGPKRNDHRRWLRSQLLAVPILDVTTTTWTLAVDLACKPELIEMNLPMSDLLIATLAMENDCFVYTLDPHFDHFPNVRRWHPR